MLATLSTLLKYSSHLHTFKHNILFSFVLLFNFVLFIFYYCLFFIQDGQRGSVLLINNTRQSALICKAMGIPESSTGSQLHSLSTSLENPV